MLFLETQYSFTFTVIHQMAPLQFLLFEAGIMWTSTVYLVVYFKTILRSSSTFHFQPFQLGFVNLASSLI